MVTFGRESVFPSWFANAIQQFISPAAFSFRVRKASATTIEVPAGPSEAAVSISVDGRWRWAEATVSRAHPGGTAGTYRIWATAAENSIVGTIDSTNYAFALAITGAAAEPAPVAGSVDIWRLVGTLEWDGAAITAVHNITDADLSGDDPLTVTSLRATRNDARALNLTGAAAGITFGGDVNLYRAGVDRLQTDDTFISQRGASWDAALAVRVSGEGFWRFLVWANGMIAWGDGINARDTNLYRSAADVLKTDDSFEVGGSFRHFGASIGFFGSAPAARGAGYGANAGVGARAALTSTSTLNEVISTLSHLVADLRAIGLVGA